MQTLTDVLSLTQHCDPVELSFANSAEWQFQNQVQISGFSPDKVFEVVADASTWPQWFPGMRSAQFLGEKGVGAERKIDMGMAQVTERFVAYEPGKRFSFYLIETSLPMGNRWLEDFEFQESHSGGTMILHKVGIDPKAPLSWLGVVAKPILQNMFAESLRNLKTYIEGK